MYSVTLTSEQGKEEMGSTAAKDKQGLKSSRDQVQKIIQRPDYIGWTKLWFQHSRDNTHSCPGAGEVGESPG